MAVRGIAEEDARAQISPQTDVIKKTHHDGLDKGKINPASSHSGVHECLGLCKGVGVACHDGQVAPRVAQAHPGATDRRQGFEDGEDEAKDKGHGGRGSGDGSIGHDAICLRALAAQFLVSLL